MEHHKNSLSSNQSNQSLMGNTEWLFRKQQKLNPQILKNLIEAEHNQKKNSQPTKRILKTGIFSWDEEFKSKINLQVIQTNFQSMKIRLHYGNFKLQILVIFTQIQESIFQECYFMGGSFGVVRFASFQGKKYAIKGISYYQKQGDPDLQNIYREYFLCLIADALEIGPKMFKLFGYDLLISKNMAYFSMEKCDQIKPNPQIIEFSLKKNIQTMHLIQFVHSDIKPTNLAFSPYYKKHVFIDFGLSKLIKQITGQKSKTTFQGTILFCSEEMRRCYFLLEPQLVDLYENDLCCLRKTLNIVKLPSCQFEVDYRLSLENGDLIYCSDTFQKIIFLLRFKYFIETSNLERLLTFFETLEMEKLTNIERIAYQIFINSSIPNIISTSKKIQQKIKTIRVRIAETHLNLNKVEVILYNIFCQRSKMISAEKIMPLAQLMQLKPQKFETILSKLDVVLKLFQFLQPFSTSTLENSLLLKKTLVEKILLIVQPQISKKELFFSEKLRYVLYYFYEKLKGLRNLKIMFSLRLMFISIEDWLFVERIENQILEGIDDPFLKTLKITEFSLFWNLLIQNYQHHRKGKWATMVENLQLGQDYLQQFRKKLFLPLVKTVNRFYIQSNEFKISLIKKFKEITKFCRFQHQMEAVYHIKYIFIELCKLHNSIFSGTPPNSFAIKIYSRYFVSLSIGLKDKFQNQQQLFQPIRILLEKQFAQSPQENLVKDAIQNYWKILNNRSQFIGGNFYQSFHVGSRYKGCLFYLQEKIRQQFKNLQNISNFSIHNRLTAINFYFAVLFQHLKLATGQERVNQQQSDYLLGEIKTDFQQFIKNTQIKQMIGQSKQLRIEIMIIEVKFAIGFKKDKNSHQIQSQLLKILDELKPLLFELPYLTEYFLSLFVYFWQDLLKKEDNFFKDILIQIGEYYAKQKKFYIFEQKFEAFGDIIRIKNQKGLERQSLELIFAFMEYFRQKKKIHVSKLPIQTFLYANQVFCLTLGQSKLAKVYGDAKYLQLQLNCGLYAYFVFNIFLTIQKGLSNQQKLRQITRTTLCLQKMEPACRKRAKSCLFRLCKPLISFKTKRKQYIFRRLGLNTLNEKQMSNFILKTVSKLKFRISNMEQVHQKFQEKIIKLSNL